MDPSMEDRMIEPKPSEILELLASAVEAYMRWLRDHAIPWLKDLDS